MAETSSAVLREQQIKELTEPLATPMGMLATVINGLAVMDCLEKMGVVVRVQTAIPMDKLAEPFIQRRAVRQLEKGRVVIFVAGAREPLSFSGHTLRCASW